MWKKNFIIRKYTEMENCVEIKALKIRTSSG